MPGLGRDPQTASSVFLLCFIGGEGPDQVLLTLAPSVIIPRQDPVGLGFNQEAHRPGQLTGAKLCRQAVNIICPPVRPGAYDHAEYKNRYLSQFSG